ncbi:MULTISPECIES: hypothetical protein [unclassified Sphingomonas]|uniref:hypothetical protein n=1 Tax=unclassified Sphingomonas TaxID=196159 RepID=UPI000A9DCC1F|nr:MULTISPECIES: hypothetical protein [unclassified Sphingomonas]
MIRASRLLVAAVALSASAPSLAEAYVDYTPQKGYWQINAIEVDPNHVDDYLTGLRRSQVGGFEILKRRGVIDDYKFMVRTGYVKGSPNVLIMTHSASTATLDADKTRDQAIEKEMLAQFSEAEGDKAVAGYEKYRTFIDDGMWTDMVMAK